MELTDTIAAIASGNRAAFRGTIRISGPDAMRCVKACFTPETKETTVVRIDRLKNAVALQGRLDLPKPFSEIDCMVYCWPDQRSYTQQPSAEFHLIGSLPILNAALRTVCASGARLAEPGEFTMRAFLAGRLDLTQAEAVLGVIDARDQQELDVALTQLSGGLTGPLSKLRTELIELLARLEAGLDFVEEDIEFISTEQLDEALCRIQAGILELTRRMTTRDHQEQLPAVVLYGWPNAGKSSLFNALASRQQVALPGEQDDGRAAIVSDVSGTTRDWLEQRFKFGSIAARLIDTAGVEQISEPESISAAAQESSQVACQRADLKLLCIDSSRDLNRWEIDQLKKLKSNQETPFIVVLTKSDLQPASTQNALVEELLRVDGKKREALPPECVVATSSESGEGLVGLRSRIADGLAAAQKTSDVVVSETARRSSDSIRLAGESIGRAIEINRSHLGEEVVAAELRSALEQLGRIVGEICNDDILDEVFSRFCIGK